jgi:hypothetical protein
VDCLGCSLPVLTELFKVVNSHQDSGQLRNLAQLLAGSFLLGILQFVLLVFNLLRLCFKLTNLVVESHDCFVHHLLISSKFRALMAKFTLFFLELTVEFSLGVLKSSVAAEDVRDFSVLIRVFSTYFFQKVLVLLDCVTLFLDSLSFLA